MHAFGLARLKLRGKKGGRVDGCSCLQSRIFAREIDPAVFGIAHRSNRDNTIQCGNSLFRIALRGSCNCFDLQPVRSVDWRRHSNWPAADNCSPPFEKHAKVSPSIISGGIGGTHRPTPILHFTGISVVHHYQKFSQRVYPPPPLLPPPSLPCPGCAWWVARDWNLDDTPRVNHWHYDFSVPLNSVL